MADNIKRARIIRYTPIGNGILSRFDKQRNILEIDPHEREVLDPAVQNLLDCTEIAETIVVSDVFGTRFVDAHIARGDH